MSLSYPNIRPSLMLDFAKTKVLDSRITFTRASTATYYDGETVALAEQNLVLQSQAFENAAWSANRLSTTTTANATTAPDGTLTADSVLASAGTSLAPRIGQSSSLSAGNYQYSIYAKSNGNDYIQLYFGAVPNSNANFDLNAGVVGTRGANVISSSIENAGNGWYRCSALITVPSSVTSATTVFISNSSSATFAQAWNPVGTEAVFLWGAQLEQRSAVTAYTPTTTAPITNYIPVLLTAASGVPRFDHSPTTNDSLGLEIEESRTNLLQRSEEFDNAYWTKNAATITANTVVAPGGTLTGDKLVEDSSSSGHYVQAVATVTNATAYAFSAYAKAGERSKVQLLMAQSTSPFTNHALVTFDLADGTIFATAAGSGSITAVGNGWYRLTVLGTSSSTGEIIRITLADAGGSSGYTGNGFNGLFIWGAQLEAGAFATSYIPTVASQVTRSGELAVMTGTNFSSWFNPNESTLYTEAATSAVPANLFHFTASLSLGTSTTAGDSVRMSYGTSKADITVGNAGTFTTMSAVTMPTYALGVAQKFALAIALNDIAVSVNGISPVTTTARTRVSNVDTLSIGASASVSSNRNLNGTIRKLAYYPRRLTNAELQALTAS